CSPRWRLDCFRPRPFGQRKIPHPDQIGGCKVRIQWPRFPDSIHRFGCGLGIPSQKEWEHGKFSPPSTPHWAFPIRWSTCFVSRLVPIHSVIAPCSYSYSPLSILLLTCLDL